MTKEEYNHFFIKLVDEEIVSPKISVIVPSFNRAKEVIECVESLLLSDYPNFEIIVVDNASQDETLSILREKFGNNPLVKIIASDKNRGAAGGRNIGVKYSSGEYILFVDSDNVVDRKMIHHLAGFLDANPDCGLVGPLMVYKKNPNIIWLYFADINMFTSQASYMGTGEKNNGQYNQIVETGHLPNCFMVRRVDFEKVGGFDEGYFIMYEEADLAEKVKRKLKKRVFVLTKAITFHDVPLPDGISCRFDFKNDKRAYLTARNRVIFMKKNASRIQFLVFFLIFNPGIFLIYEFNLLKKASFKKGWAYFKGNIHGFLGL